MAIGGYFERAETIDEWLFSGAPASVKAGPAAVPPAGIPLDAGRVDQLDRRRRACGMERALEPCATAEAADREPKVADSRIAPYFLHLLCRKERPRY